MASPQKEKGYTAIANEIMEVIMKTNLNGTQFRIVMAIWRSTYGYHKKEKEISYSTLAEYIEASRSQVAREIRKYFGADVFQTVIPRNVRIAEAPSHGKPVNAYSRMSKGAEAYDRLAIEFFRRERRTEEQNVR